MNREAFEAWQKSRSIEPQLTDYEIFNAGFNAAIASQAQQESKLHWCGTCEQNVERGCGDSACQYRYKLPPAPMNEVNKPEGEKL